MKKRQLVVVVDRDEGVKDSVNSLSDDLLLTHGEAEKVLRESYGLWKLTTPTQLSQTSAKVLMALPKKLLSQ